MPGECAHTNVVRLADHLHSRDRMNCLDCQGYRLLTLDGWTDWCQPEHVHAWTEWSPWEPATSGNGVPVEKRARFCLDCGTTERQVAFDEADAPRG